MAHVKRDDNLLGHRVARAWLKANITKCDPRRWAGSLGNLIDCTDDGMHRAHRIAPARHRRRAGVNGIADQLDVIPAHSLHTGDDADLTALRFQYRALLNVRLERRLEQLDIGRDSL